ncbi:hypothetical protein [Mycolicibacterium sp. CBMA 234]|uniref:hypothetical protein n=1 Tax=Mycolicibacterium sp. CBMA 234 TaxID=1918495 RepID=UPI0012DD49B6|nr:hypothetical protein [Mycolicibacterium sp. CBMA 234]
MTSPMAKTFGFVGIVAGVTLGVLGVSNAPAPDSTPVASSGHGASTGMYTQPSVADMNVGATATMTTPSNVEAVQMAVPPVKAAPYHG